MSKLIRYGKGSKAQFFNVVVTDVHPEHLDDPLRCPKCGAKVPDTCVIAGWRQYGFPGPQSFDEITLLIVCEECNAHTGYIARIWTSA